MFLDREGRSREVDKKHSILCFIRPLSSTVNGLLTVDKNRNPTTPEARRRRDLLRQVSTVERSGLRGHGHPLGLFPLKEENVGETLPE